MKKPNREPNRSSEVSGLTGTPYELVLCAATQSAGADIHTSMDWEEVTR